LRICPATVVADDNAQLPDFVFYRDFDMPSVRAVQRIGYGFATDAVNFVTDDRVYWPWAALDRDAKINLLAGSELLLDAGECLFDIK